MAQARREGTHAHLARAWTLDAADALLREQREQALDVIGARCQRQHLLDVIGDGLERNLRLSRDVATGLDRRGELQQIAGPLLAVPAIDRGVGLVHVLRTLQAPQARDDFFDLVRHRLRQGARSDERSQRAT